MEKSVFERFNEGKLRLKGSEKDFAEIAWSKHPVFEGVELKHIITAKDTGGAFSYHLVRIAPDKSIGNHIHETQLETHEVIAGRGECINDGARIAYEPGVISIMGAKVPHEVNAGSEGLYLFAKFFPALCSGLSCPHRGAVSELSAPLPPAKGRERFEASAKATGYCTGPRYSGDAPSS